MAALQQPGELLGRLLAPGHELLPRLQPGGQVLPLLYQAGQAGLLRLLGLPGLLGLPADLPGPPQLLLALGELGGLLGQGHRLSPQGGGLLPLPLGGLVGLLRLLVPLPGGGQGPGRRDLRLGEPFPLLPGLQKGLGLLDALPQGGVFLPQGLDLPRLLLHRLGQGLRGVLAFLAQQGLPQGRELPGLLLQGLGPLLEPLLHVLPHLGGEQGPQNVPLLLGAGPQQPQKLPLGQHDHLGELLAAQVQKLLGPAADGALAAALHQGELPVLQMVALVAVPGLGELCVPVDMHVDAPPEPVHLPLQSEVKLHHRGHVLAGAHAPHGREAPLAPGGLAVQGKAHGVQKGGLAPAGGPGDEEQPVLRQGGEVQLRRLQIGPKGL